MVLQGKATLSGQTLVLQSVDVMSELKGTITAIDLTAGTLKVVDTLVTVNALTRLVQELPGHTFSDLTLADIAVGNLVAVFGTRQAAGDILATRIEREQPGTGGESEARGTVSSFNATAKTFSLLAYKVDYSGAMLEGTLAEGATVEVEGALSPTDPTLLVAVKVEVRFAPMGNGATDKKGKGAITALSGPDRTLAVAGVTYWAHAQTLILEHDAPLTFAQLVVGDRADVRALSTRTNAAGQTYAVRIERNPSDM